MIGRCAAFAAAVTLVANPAVAADTPSAAIGSVKGTVLVSRDGRMLDAKGLTSLKTGDRVVVKDGETSITYADGCVVRLKPQAMASIGAASPCKDTRSLISADSGASAQILGLDGLALALVGFGLLVLTFVLLEDDDDPLPVSP